MVCSITNTVFNNKILRKNLVNFVQKIKSFSISFKNESLVKTILNMEEELLKKQNLRKEAQITVNETKINLII